MDNNNYLCKTKNLKIMRKILFFIVLCCCISANAQRVDKPGEAYDYFCEVALTNENKAMIFLPEKDDNDALIICDSLNTPLVFHNEKDMLVYMTKRGWVYIEKVIHDIHGPIISLSRKAYFLKKTVKDDSQVLCGLLLNEINIKKKKKKED